MTKKQSNEEAEAMDVDAENAEQDQVVNAQEKGAGLGDWERSLTPRYLRQHPHRDPW
jgi:hypothetical protein